MPDIDFYTGAYTGAQIDQRLGNMIVVVSGTITAQNKQINNSKILANHVVLDLQISNVNAMPSAWTINTYAGYLTITGDVAASTNVIIKLGLS